MNALAPSLGAQNAIADGLPAKRISVRRLQSTFDFLCTENGANKKSPHAFVLRSSLHIYHSPFKRLHQQCRVAFHVQLHGHNKVNCYCSWVKLVVIYSCNDSIALVVHVVVAAVKTTLFFSFISSWLQL